MSEQEKPTIADFKYEWTITAEPTEEVVESEQFLSCLQDSRFGRIDLRGPVTASAWESAQDAAWEAFMETLVEELDEYDMSDFEVDK